jgi:hypothetical protein
MALTDENSNGMVMPVAPMYGSNNNGGFGGDSWGWIILLLLLAGGGWGNGFGGYGGGQLGYDFPWLMNGQQGINNNVSDGFRDAQLNDNVTSVRDGISALSTQLCGCCGDIQNSLCNGFNGVTGAVTGAQNAISQQMYTNQIADLNRSFDSQTAITQGMNTIAMNQQNCCFENRAGIADLKYTVATENCADRAAVSDGIRDVIANNTANSQNVLNVINAGIQSIKDQLCQDKIDAKNDEISQLRQELLYSRGQASQDVQTSAIRAGQATTANQLVQELRSCPIPSMPVYGQTPIFTCNQNQCGCNGGCGCGM